MKPFSSAISWTNPPRYRTTIMHRRDRPSLGQPSPVLLACPSSSGGITIRKRRRLRLLWTSSVTAAVTTVASAHFWALLWVPQLSSTVEALSYGSMAMRSVAASTRSSSWWSTSLAATTRGRATTAAWVDIGEEESGIASGTIAQRRVSTRSKTVKQYVADDDDEEDDDDDVFEDFSMSEFLELQKSTGSEVLQSDLQQQIDRALQTHPDLFLDFQADGSSGVSGKYGKDHVPVSELEKRAMSSVTAQLPQRAVQALTYAAAAQQEGQLRRPISSSSSSRATISNPRLHRVTHEQELRLARLIQQGAVLQAVRTKLQQELGGTHEPTKQEWADAAGLTAKELRRRISYYRKAKHDLVTANMGLVHAVVNQQWSYLKRTTGITKEELIQEGSLGLLRAAELFDPSRGLRFSTYAVVWIKGTLSNSHFHELVRLPTREKGKWNKIVKAQKELEEVNGGKATIDQLAAATGLTTEQVLVTQRRMVQAQRVLSLDYEYQQQSRSGMESSKIGISLHHDKNLQEEYDLAERTQLHADVLAALASNLDAREARLMRLRYGLSDGHPRSLTACAQAMGLSYTRVNQLAARCLNKLRKVKEVEALEEYLLTIA